ncbi:hypothetical protein PLESTB_001043000 [Pleodorina starrii]|uniref:Uncharacterized protein n=1 Tax=Pleodorina starrii TaxID=330485 RepID=A0A9W6BPK3_9CHLO|nr:hypothetical protein PLESTB_001043000 [Pleodorina starrii]
MKTPASNAWTTKLCDCCGEPTGCKFCWYAYCCACCAYGSNVDLMEPVVCCGGECLPACLAYAGMVYMGCPCILQTMTRGYIRNKYGIPGSACGDFMIAWCCSACSMCQERRELLIRGHGKGGVVQGAQEPPQQQQMLMVPLSVPVSVSVPVPVAVSVPVPGYPVVQPSDDLAPKPSDSAPKPSDAAPEPDGQQKSVKGDLPSLPTEADEQGSRPSLPTEADEQGKAV